MAEYEVFKKGEFIDCDKAIKVVSYAFSIDEEGNSLVSLRFSGDMIEEISSLRFVMTQIAANDEVIAEGEVICDKIVYFEDGTFSPKAMIPVFGDCEGISIKVKEVVAGRYRYDGNRDKTDFSPVDKQDKSKPKKRKKRAAESDKAATPITLIFSSLILSLAVAVIAVFGFLEYQNKTDTFVRDGIIYQFATGDRSTGEIKVAGTVTNLISKKELYIPEIIDGMRVTEIKDSAFRNNGAISKIEFEGNVKKVGSFAFSDCVNLKEIDFEGIEEVGENAFERCGIETVNSSTLKTVGSNAFSACYSLKNVELGADVVSLDQNAFSNCVALESFSVKKTRINVDSGIFRGSRIRDLYLSELPESLGNSNVKATISQLFSANNFSYYSDDSGYAKNITLKKADRIAEYLCAGIKGLEKFTINDIKEGTIGAGAFENCSSLTSVSLNKRVNRLGSGAFRNSGISSFDGGELIDIGSEAFAGCKNLSEYPLRRNASIRVIPDGCFRDCSSLKNVIISGFVTGINAEAFSGCRGMVTFDFNSSPVEYIHENAFYKCVELLSAALPKTVGTIYPHAFDGCAKLASVNLDAVRDIGEYAFADCSSLSRVEINENAESIGSFAFKNDNNLAYLSTPFIGWSKYDATNFNYLFDFESVPSNLKEVAITNDDFISYGCFSNCSHIEKITLGKSVEYIDSFAFSQCSNLRTVVLPRYLNYIGDGAFSGCLKLYEVLNDSGLKITVGDWDQGEVARRAVYVGKSDQPMPRTYLGDYEFGLSGEEWYLLNFTGEDKNLYLPTIASIPTYKIPDDLFYGCDFEEVSIPGCVSGIGAEAFMECRKLRSVDYSGTQITEISERCFWGCEKLEKAVVPDTVSIVREQAFLDCVNLESVTLPKGLRDIYYDAFFNCQRLYEVFDLSFYIDVVAGNADYGYVGYYAFFIHTNENDIPMRKTTVSGVEYRYCGGDYLVVGGNGSRTLQITPSSLPDADGVYIRNYAFSDNSTIVDLTLGRNVIEIGEGAFSSCNALERVEIDASADSIKQATFAWCYNLKEVEIGEVIVAIDNYAFSGCENLGKAVVRGKLIKSRVASDAFLNCSRLFEVYNLSGLDIYAGSQSYGMIAYNALKVYTDLSQGPIKYAEYDGFRFAYYDDRWNLFEGNTSFVNLPDTPYLDGEIVDAYYLLKRATIYYGGILYAPRSLVGIESGTLENFHAIYYYGTENEWNTNKSRFPGYSSVSVYYYKECIHGDEENKYWRKGDYGNKTNEQTVGNYTIEKQSTCSENGLEKFICPYCNKDFTRELNRLTHEIVDGHCLLCGAEFEETELTEKNYSALGLKLKRGEYGFEFSDGALVCSNSFINDSTAEMTFTATGEAQLILEYSISSEYYSDIMFITVNGEWVKEDSGYSVSKATISLKKGDVVSIKYIKNESYSSTIDKLTINRFLVYYKKV